MQRTVLRCKRKFYTRRTLSTVPGFYTDYDYHMSHYKAGFEDTRNFLVFYDGNNNE
jgi:hypothetical protein